MAKQQPKQAPKQAPPQQQRLVRPRRIKTFAEVEAESMTFTADIVARLADEVRQGNISRQMAVGNAMVSLGLSRETAERLFPPAKVVVRPSPPQVVRERTRPVVVYVERPAPEQERREVDLFSETPPPEPRTIRKTQRIERDERGFVSRVIEESTVVDESDVETFAETGQSVREVERDERGFVSRVVEQSQP